MLVASGLASLLLAISKGNDWGWGSGGIVVLFTGAGLIGPLPAESGYTDALLMGAIASGCALLASPLLPGRR